MCARAGVLLLIENGLDVRFRAKSGVNDVEIGVDIYGGILYILYSL